MRAKKIRRLGPEKVEEAVCRSSSPCLARQLQRFCRCAAILVAIAVCGVAFAANDYFCTGMCNPTVTVNLSSTRSKTPSYVLMGGGPDVDQAFRWMIHQAGVRGQAEGYTPTGGRFVIIRATGTDAYNPYIYYSDAGNSTGIEGVDGWVGGAYHGLGSVETLIIPDRKRANSDEVYKILSSANAVFIAGGDQSHYIKYWKGTRVEETLKSLMGANVPIGGTSAGLTVLGQFDFAALNGTVSSTQALSDPYNKYMSFDPLTSYGSFTRSGGFLAPPALFNVIFDSHLDSRDRMGRFITFVSREVGKTASTPGCPGGILNAGKPSNWTSLDFGSNYPDNVARGIGIGVETALLVSVRDTDKHVVAKRVTNPSTTTASAAYFVSLKFEIPELRPTRCEKGAALSMPEVNVQRVDAVRTLFDLSTWSGGTSYQLKVLDGKVVGNPIY